MDLPPNLKYHVLLYWTDQDQEISDVRYMNLYLFHFHH
eukprot:UN04796